MKIKGQRRDFLCGLQSSIRAIPIKTTNPMLACLLVETTEDKVKLTGNNMEIGISTVIEAMVENPSIVAIDAKMLIDIMRKLSDDAVEITVDEKNFVTLKCGKTKFKINGMNGEAYPRLPITKGDNALTISQAVFRDIIRRTSFATDESTGRAMMSGENIVLDNGNLRITALDGYRVAIRNVHVSNNSNDFNIIVPTKALLEVSRIINGSVDEDIEIELARNHVVFKFNNTIAVSRLIDGEYYDIDRIMPQDFNTVVKVDREELAECLGRSMLMSSESDKKPVVFEIHDDQLNVDANTQRGDFREVISISKEGNDLTIAFNPGIMLDAIQAIEHDEIAMYFNQANSPCVIRDDESYVYMVLPVNINRG